VSATGIYFAYGSNMSSLRLRERLPTARSLGAARLPGWRLAPNKPGKDGSGKANLVADPGAAVWGVLYELIAADWPTLDRFEPGYTRLPQPIEDGRSRLQRAQVYVFTQHGPDLAMHHWYREHLLQGAREHALPTDYITALETLPVLAP
jgi:hypothetical protein